MLRYLSYKVPADEYPSIIFAPNGGFYLYNRFIKKFNIEVSQFRLQVVKHRYLLEFLEQR